MVDLAGSERLIWRRTPRKAGFSLIIVLLIAIAGMASLGAIAYTFGAFSSTAAAVIYKDKEFNAMQNEIERAKAALADKMKGESEPMKCQLKKVGVLGGLIQADKFVAADALVIYAHDDPDDKPFGMRPDVPWSHGDKTGVLRVRIYDMQYRNAITSNIDGVRIASRGDFASDAEYEAFLADLPPAFPPRRPNPSPEDPDNTFSGVYLIRVTLILEGEEQKRIQTAVIQSVGEEE